MLRRILPAMRVALVLIASLSATAAAAQDHPPDAQPIPEPPPDVELRPVTVRFRADAPGVRVHYLPDPVLDDAPGGGVRVRLAPASRYDLLCEAPCDAQLPQSHFGLAIGRADRLVRLPEPLGVDGPTGVRIDWQSREVERTAGLLTLSIGAPLGAAAAALAIGLDLGSGGDGVGAAVGSGIGTFVLAAAVVIGVVLLVSEDGASVTVTPLPAEGGALFSEEWR